jgi:hypothetical protein
VPPLATWLAVLLNARCSQTGQAVQRAPDLDDTVEEIFRPELARE